MTGYNWTDSTMLLNAKRMCVICDLDGTLAIFRNADGTFIRDPFDCSECENDLINVPLAMMLQIMKNADYKIIFVTGRDEKWRAQTEKFIIRVCDDYCLGYGYELWMRKSGDKRDDCVVKKEIFDDLICGRYIPMCVFEDRPRVVKMWREMGLFVFDCNYYVGSVVDEKFDRYFNKK